jgi:dienelactone hydrolase
MKHCFSFFVIILLSIPVLCQTAAPSIIPSKPIIDSAAVANWYDLHDSQTSISTDGKYFMYSIENLPAGSSTLVIQSTENEWKKKFVGAEKGFFSDDSKLAVFKNGDSLFTLSLPKDKILGIANVASYKTQGKGARQRLVYLTKTNELIVQNLFTGKKKQFTNVSEYQFDNSGRVLLLNKNIKKDNIISESIELVNMSTGNVYSVWQTSNGKERMASRFSFDETGKQLVFIVQDKIKGDPSNTIWYYREGGKAIEKVSNQTVGIDSGMFLSRSAAKFSKNGKYIFFEIEPIPQPSPKPNPGGVQVDVWSYKDLVRQNLQLYSLNNPNAYPTIWLEKQLKSVISVDGHQAICLEKSGVVSSVFTDCPADIAIAKVKKYTGDKYWLNEPTNYYLISLITGESTLLASGSCNDFSFSNDGKYLVYFDQEKQAVYSHEFQSGRTINISHNVPERITTEVDKGSRYKPLAVGFAGWWGDRAFIIYDNYDIWKIDVTGKTAPINLTKGYGKEHRIKFRVLNEPNLIQASYSENQPLLLSAFNVQNKNNGFFKLHLKGNGDLAQLSMGACLYASIGGQTYISLPGMEPLKASNTNVWIVKRQSATEAPNFFITKNFKYFRQLTNIQPQKKYNWLSANLITWQHPNGASVQGILYKPENFDSSKKYPVIVHYYQERSDQLNEFLNPTFTDGDIDIPWFVSRGYIVFVPDIHYTVGKTGESVVNSVLSGVSNLCNFSYIDSTKLGLQGQSFGGYETNYLITHTNKFAAAMGSAGFTNLISCYGTLLPDGSVNEPSGKNMNIEANGPYRIQATLWENREAYIANSPIFDADKVTTPLLIRQNKRDQLVPWQQGVEFFIALRRLNKNVWMLQYDNGGHGVGSLKKDKIDHTKRIEQFFDHYLKESPAPKWMTEGIPARLKGIETGYELDLSGTCGEDCNVCKKLQAK